MYVFEQLGRRLVSFKQNPFALPTFNVLPLFFFFLLLSGRAEMDAALSFLSSPMLLASKTPQSCQARRCFSGEDLKFQSI